MTTTEPAAAPCWIWAAMLGVVGDECNVRRKSWVKVVVDRTPLRSGRVYMVNVVPVESRDRQDSRVVLSTESAGMKGSGGGQVRRIDGKVMYSKNRTRELKQSS